MLVEADAFLAKKVFFPVIIAIFRLTGVTQYGFASYASVLSLLCIVPLITKGGNGANLLAQGVILAFVAAMVAYHAMRPEMLRSSRGFWRAFNWAMVCLNVLDYAEGKFQIFALLMWTFQLFAEYALMIDTIPPRETRKSAAASQGR